MMRNAAWATEGGMGAAAPSTRSGVETEARSPKVASKRRTRPAPAQLVSCLAYGKSLAYRELRGLCGIVGDLLASELEPNSDVNQVVLDAVVHLLREAIPVVGESNLLPQPGVLLDP